MSSDAPTSLPRIALIGVSGYGTIYHQLLRTAAKEHRVRFVAAVIINPAQVADAVAELQAGGTTIYASAEEFFAMESGKIDLCMIPTGIQWHARLTIAALHAGMNVLVEKPLAGSLADTAAMRQAEVATGRWVAVGFQDVYANEARRLKERILSGAIGRLQEIRMIGLWPRPRAYFARNHWAGRIEADGAAVLDSPLNNAFAHFVNLGLFFAGPSADTSASVRIDSAELLRAHPIEMFDTAVIRGVSPEGVRFWLGFSHATRETRQPEIHLEGDTGSAEWQHEGDCEIVSADGSREIIPLPDAVACRETMFDLVLSRLRDPGAFVCTTVIAEQHVRLIEAVQSSGKIRTIADEFIDWIPNASTGDETPAVRGLEAALERAMHQDSPLSSVVSLTRSPSVPSFVS
jgi:predicted dehydrogenase